VIIKPVKKKEAAAKEVAAPAKKKAVAAAEEQDLGAEPVVLVPPAQPIAPPSQTETDIASNVPISQQGGTEAAPAKKKKTIFDLFRGSDEATAPAEETQVAAVQPKTTTAAKPAPAPQEAPSPQQASTGGSGFVVQLASFRSQAEAQSEYGRLSSLYPTVVGGLPQRVAQSKVGGSTRYQLGLGPIKSRSEATRVCSALFQAGERDCIVRSQ
jgi:cell division protein FtsN